MKYYDVNDNNNEVIERQNDSDYADKGYDFESSVMISRRERNKRKKGLKFIVKKKGRRYKKNEKKSIRNIFLKLKSKCIVITIIMFGTVYILFHLYFENHFFLGSEINCINISGKSVEDAEEYLEECIDDYTLTLKGRDGVTNVIYGNDFNLKYSQDISDVINKKKEMIQVYQSQINDKDYFNGILGLNKYRGMFYNHEYSEAFKYSGYNNFTAAVYNLLPEAVKALIRKVLSR